MNLPLSELTSEARTVTPNTSPRGSPKPVAKIHTNNKDHHHGDTFLTINDSSPGQESNTSSHSNLETISSDVNSKDKKDVIRIVEKAKKKSSWYNAFSSTYKSKSEDFKRIFKEVPDDERLVVDYSCALQKEILVHGRLYVSQNYLCFYANIFGWETNVTIKWKEVSAITKEKTALVIPNAVLISTKTEKYFFASFAARDKTYLILFRIWQNALLEQPMSNSELWQMVRESYGEELGLTSDDDDYFQAGLDDDKLPTAMVLDSLVENDYASTNTEILIPESFNIEEKIEDKNVSPVLNEIQNGTTDNNLPTDQSDTTESDVEKTNVFELPVVCTASHAGRQLLYEIYPMHVDQLFTLLFTSSKFFLDFHASRKTTDLIQTAWKHNPEDNTKTRIVNLTIALTQSVGPKTCQVTETQVMLPCSRAGSMYSIDLDSVNAGIPYADAFNVAMHYCLQKVADAQSSLTIYAQILYGKPVWSIVRNFIEKNCWQGMEEYCRSLSNALYAECEEGIPAVKRKSRRRRRVQSVHMLRQETDISHHSAIGTCSNNVNVPNSSVFSSDMANLIVFGVLILLVILNAMLYYKLWLLEDSAPYRLIDLYLLKDPPSSHEEWIQLLQKQETLHTIEMHRWQKVLKSSISLLKQIEEQLNDLQHSIHPTYTSKIMSIIKSHKDTVNKAQEL